MRNKYIEADVFRVYGCYNATSCRKLLFSSKTFRHLYYYRKYKYAVNKLERCYYHILYCLNIKNSGIELSPSVDLGKGVLFLHPTGITINTKVRAGCNLTMLKGSTIGNIKAGKREGVPQLGDNVYIGLNSTVVGGITIGDDVLIAPNTFVNFDIPDHSIVIGNPAVIHYKDNATLNYINNPIDNGGFYK